MRPKREHAKRSARHGKGERIERERIAKIEADPGFVAFLAKIEAMRDGDMITIGMLRNGSRIYDVDVTRTDSGYFAQDDRDVLHAQPLSAKAALHYAWSICDFIGACDSLLDEVRERFGREMRDDQVPRLVDEILNAWGWRPHVKPNFEDFLVERARDFIERLHDEEAAVSDEDADEAECG